MWATQRRHYAPWAIFPQPLPNDGFDISAAGRADVLALGETMARQHGATREARASRRGTPRLRGNPWHYGRLESDASAIRPRLPFQWAACHADRRKGGVYGAERRVAHLLVVCGRGSLQEPTSPGPRSAKTGSLMGRRVRADCWPKTNAHRLGTQAIKEEGKREGLR